MTKPSLPERIESVKKQAATRSMIEKLAAAEEKRAGLPAGTVSSIVAQETGWQQRFLVDPSEAHYKTGSDGKKPKSSARGLGGILKDTARDPGYGVAPLKDWTVPEQLRFIADYAMAQIKRTGSVEKGLAAYGEGDKYAEQVAKRIPGMGNAVATAPPSLEPRRMTQVAAPVRQPQPIAVAELPRMPPAQAFMQAQAQQPVQAAQQVQAPAQPAGVNPEWEALQSLLPNKSMQAADLDYGNAAPQRVAFGDPDMGEADSAQRMHSILKRFGLGRYSDGDMERYQVSIPEFSRAEG